MQSKSFTILAVAILAPLTWAGPFSLRYHTTSGCGGTSLGCSSYEAYQCCEEPPSPSSFPYARVNSDGTTGFVVFTEVTQDGGCGLCEATGALNQCYFNNPFNTMFAASISQCQNTAVAGRDPSEKRAVLPETKRQECNGTVPLDVAEIGGKVYDITGSDREQIMVDALGLSEDEFHEKWNSVRRGPTPTNN